MTIRSATLHDVPALMALEQQIPAAAHWAAAHYVTRIAGRVVLLAEQAGQLCGFLCAHAVAGEWEIENLAVAAEFLRRGVASELLAELICRAWVESSSAIHLEVRESNLPARRLYEKHGFREIGRRSTYYRNPPEDAILYALHIGG